MGKYDFELELDSENTMSVMNRWIRPGSRVLEFGPANGRLTKFLSETKACCVTIVEIDEESGREATLYAHKSYIGSIQGDIEQYHWLDDEQQYDYILFADVLEHLHEPEIVLEKCAKLLREGGCILLSVPNLAHNSVILSLINDQFCYSDTGLLDRTHIHFFTYHTLMQMVKESGYTLEELVPIYSRVGDNEIDATYAQVPMAVERFLRKRDSGYIYQFVCKITRNGDSVPEKEEIKPFMQEYSPKIEAQFYFATEEKTVFSADNYTGIVADVDGEIQMELVVPEGVNTIRFDPLEAQAILFVRCVELVDATGNAIAFAIDDTNADFSMNRLYCFAHSDPQFIFRFEKPAAEKTVFRVAYKVLSFAETVDYYREIVSLLTQESKNCPNAQMQDGEKSELEELREAVAFWENAYQEAKTYNAHLEQDIAARKEAYEIERKKYESDLDEVKAWNAHLEQDIAAWKEAYEIERKKYESDLDEAKAWITHMEQDIEVLKKEKENE